MQALARTPRAGTLFSKWDGTLTFVCKNPSPPPFPFKKTQNFFLPPPNSNLMLDKPEEGDEESSCARRPCYLLNALQMTGQDQEKARDKVEYKI